mgnify:CR=1 FL=1
MTSRPQSSIKDSRSQKQMNMEAQTIPFTEIMRYLDENQISYLPMAALEVRSFEIEKLSLEKATEILDFLRSKKHQGILELKVEVLGGKEIDLIGITMGKTKIEHKNILTFISPREKALELDSKDPKNKYHFSEYLKENSCQVYMDLIKINYMKADFPHA